MHRRFALVLFLTVGTLALAQELPDAGLPDGSVGQGGADRDNEESDGTNDPCLDSRTCSNGFTCVDARCVPAPVKDLGCSSVPGLMVALAALLVRFKRR